MFRGVWGVTPGLPRSRAAVWGRSLPETPPSPGAGQKRRERSGRRRCRRDRSTGSRAAGASTSPGSSLNSSEEHLNSPADTYTTKAKLGDTQELEEFIADLDKALEEM